MIVGIVVLYNPENNIIENIKTYLDDLDKLYIIDNSEKFKLKDFIENSKIEYIKNNVNLGIAKALNIGIAKAFENYEVKYILTMDQDSFFSKGEFKKFVNKILENKEKDIVIYSPTHLMSESKINKTKEKKIVMTSGNVLEVENLKKVGYFFEDFFIDEVDHEFCYRIYEKEMKIVIYEDIYLNHQLGERKNLNKIIGTNHNPIRRYYITRNKLYMVQKYPFLKRKYYTQLFFSLIRIIFFENKKKDKIKFFIKGCIDYKHQKKGALIN